MTLLECKEIQKEIHSFLSDDLEGKKMQQFVAHVKSCPECMEETTIQYLATEGINRLEDGLAFNLDQELEEKIEHVEKQQRFSKHLSYFMIALEVISLLVIAMVFFYYFY